MLVYRRVIGSALRTCALLSLLPGAAAAQIAAAPQAPRTYLSTSMPAVTGRTIAVAAGGDFQGALNAAQPGDAITLQAGATFGGTFTLPVKSGAGWITIRSSAESQLPGQGTRISPAYASAMPKLVATSSNAVIQTQAGAHHYRFVGVEFTVASGVNGNYGLIQLGSAGDSSLSQLPNNIVFDRVYVHGSATGNLRRGIAMNSASTAVIDSYISEVHDVSADSQAIGCWNGPGPFKIVNNYLEAAGENVLFGGADPTVPNLVPSDIEMRRNQFSKPRKWRVGDPSFAGITWTVKNIFELKNAQRVLVDGNIFEYNWAAAQNGFAILFTVRNQDGTAPWSVVQDVIFTHNVVRHIAAAINILGVDNLHPSQQVKRLLIADNVFTDVSTAWGGNGRLVQILDSPSDVVFSHNTAFQTGDMLYASGAPAQNFEYKNNITQLGQYGFIGDGTGTAVTTISRYFPGAIVVANAVIGGSASSFPGGNYFPSSASAVGFTNYTGGDYSLAASSPYKGAGTDGRDLGADIGAVNAALGGAFTPPPTGGGGGTTTSDLTAPSVAVTAPSTGVSAAGLVALSASASDNVAVVGVQFSVDGLPVGGESMAGPFTTTWNSASVTNGTHMIRAVARDAAGNSSTSAAVSVNVVNGTTGGTTSTSNAIVWARAVHFAAAGTSVQKSGGCNGCQDSGASTQQSIASGSGYVQFTVPDTLTQRVIGLSTGDTDTSEADIDFALKFWPGGTVDIRRNGRYNNRETSYKAGDVFRVAVANGTITFVKNGAVLYTLNNAARYPLLVDVAFTSARGRFDNVTFTAAAPTTTPTSPTPVPGATVSWTRLMNVASVNGLLQKVAGCNGCPDGGASSVQAITSGYVEFSAVDTTGQRVIGLSSGDTNTAEADIDYGLKFWPGGTVDVREFGLYINAETSYTSVDVFRIAVSGGLVTYLKNGQVFYRSLRPVAAPLLVDTSFSSMYTAFSKITIVGN